MMYFLQYDVNRSRIGYVNIELYLMVMFLVSTTSVCICAQRGKNLFCAKLSATIDQLHIMSPILSVPSGCAMPILLTACS